MVIVFQRGDEEPQAFPLGKPGGDISIAWGEPTRRAAIWKVVASPNGNVYVMERKTGSYLKASLHQSKVWRYAWVERAAESSPMVQSFVEATGDRVIDRWDRPQALPGGTLTIGYTIFTTGEDVRVAKDDPKVTSKVGWLPPPAVGQMAYFTLAMVRPNRQQIHLRHALPVAAFAMNAGEALLVTATRRAIKPEEKEQLRVVHGRLALARPTLVQPCPTPRSPGRCCMARATPAAVTCSTSPSDCCRRVPRAWEASSDCSGRGDPTARRAWALTVVVRG